MMQLAAQCRTALSRAGFNVPPREYDEKAAKDTNKDTRSDRLAIDVENPLLCPGNKSCACSAKADKLKTSCI